MFVPYSYQYWISFATHSCCLRNWTSFCLLLPVLLQVLMQTRSDKMRAKMLGLRIVKYFVENLKEEYLVLLAETIPFLGELLEDVEISVKSLAQDILQEMESLSGESLRQYLWCSFQGCYDICNQLINPIHSPCKFCLFKQS